MNRLQYTSNIGEQTSYLITAIIIDLVPLNKDFLQQKPLSVATDLHQQLTAASLSSNNSIKWDNPN